MNAIQRFAASAVLFALLSASATAQIYIEPTGSAGDAGNLAITPPTNLSGASYTEIRGDVNNAQTGTDCYRITINNAAIFKAEITRFEPGTGLGQLFLFQPNKLGLYGDEGTPGVEFARIDAADFAAAGGVQDQDYILCVNAQDNDPLNAAGQELFPEPEGIASAPNGDNVLASYSQNGPMIAPGERYTISLRGVGPVGGSPSYNLTFQNQQGPTAMPGDNATFRLFAENIGNASGMLKLVGRVRNPSSVVIYTTTSETKTLAPGESKTFTVNVRVPSDCTNGTYTVELDAATSSMVVIASQTYSITVSGCPTPFSGGGSAPPFASAQAGSTDGAVAGTGIGAYPNPFNPTTQIRFTLAESAAVNLSVYDVMGREVTTLVQGMLEAGSHTATFDASALATGTYVYRLTVGQQVMTGQLTLLR